MEIKEIEKIARERYSEDDLKYHIIPVVKNALLLAEKLKADKEIIEAGAWLHDIGRAIPRGTFEKENEHHIIGAEETEKLLLEMNFENDFISKVKHCVLAHRGRKDPEPETIEAKIVNCADAMSHFDTFLDLFSFFLKSCSSFEEAVDEVEQKMERNWNKKLSLPEAKEIVKDKYEAIMLLIKSMKEYMK